MVRSPPLALALFHELDTRVLESLRSFGGPRCVSGISWPIAIKFDGE